MAQASLVEEGANGPHEPLSGFLQEAEASQYDPRRRFRRASGSRNLGDAGQRAENHGQTVVENLDAIDSAPPAECARSLEVLLPALNEERGVGSVIDHIPMATLRQRGYDVRVWVVDGRSTDSTLRIAREKGAKVFLQHGEGKGNGIRQAIDHLLQGNQTLTDGSRAFIMLDADGSYPADCIPKFLDALEAGMDVVLGSRFRGRVEDGAVTPLNRLGNRCLSRLASLLFGTRVTDVCTGMWAFREDAIRKFGLAAQGFDLEADLFASSCEAGVRLGEFPIEYHRRIGEPKLVPLRTGFVIAWRLLMKRLNHQRAAPPIAGARPRAGDGEPSPLALRSAEPQPLEETRAFRNERKPTGG